MAKPLTLLNQDIAQAFRLHSITQPPSAFELTDLDKELLQTILATKISPRQKVDKFHNILHRYKNILEQYQDSNTQPTNQIPQPMPASMPISPKKMDEIKKEDTPPPPSKKSPAEKLTVRSPRNQALLDLQNILEEKDRSFDARPGRIVLKDKEISDRTFHNVLESFKKAKHPPLRHEQNQVRQMIYDVAKEHPNFMNVIKKLPGLKNYVSEKTTMTTRTDKASPYDARRNLQDLDSSFEDDNYEGNTFENIDMDPNITAITASTPARPPIPKPKETKKPRKSYTTVAKASKPAHRAKKGSGGIVHMKRWQQHIRSTNKKKKPRMK
jgi:hypothetical protein